MSIVYFLMSREFFKIWIFVIFMFVIFFFWFFFFFSSRRRHTRWNCDWSSDVCSSDLMFRYWYDYSGGTMTDWGAHHNDIALWAIGLPAPVEIEGKALAQPIPGGYTAFSEYEVKFVYANGVTHTARTTKADNIFGGVEDPQGQRNGIRFEGSEGWIWVNRGNLRAS